MSQSTLSPAPAVHAAAITLEPPVFGKLQRLTDANCHTDAYILGCRVLLLLELEAEFEKIKAQAELDGHLAYPQYTARTDFFGQMMEKAYGLLSADQYKQFESCF